MTALGPGAHDGHGEQRGHANAASSSVDVILEASMFATFIFTFLLLSVFPKLKHDDHFTVY